MGAPTPPAPRVHKFKFVSECKIPYFINRLLFPGERIVVCLKAAVRDMMVITDRRFLIINKQYVSGKSVEYVSCMFKNIINYSFSTPGLVMDYDVDFKANFINGDLVHMEFSKGKDIEKYIFLTYDLVSAVIDGHPVAKGILDCSISVEDNNEQFFE